MPSKLTKLALQNIGFTRATNAVKSDGSAFFQAFPQKPKDLEVEVDFSQFAGFSLNDATAGATNVTVVEKSVTLPQENYGGNYVYEPGKASPFIFRESPLLELTATLANGTVVFDKNKLNFSDTNYFYVVYRKTSGALSAGDVQFVVRSSVGNYVTLTNVKTAAQNEWVYEIFKLQEDGTSGVAFTGSPDFSVRMEVDIIIVNNTDVLEVSKLYGAATEYALPPTEISFDLGDTCLDSLAQEKGIETFDLTCALDLDDKVTTANNPSWSFTVKKPSMLLEAVAYGTVPKPTEIETEQTVELTITSNVASLGSNVGSGQTYTDVKSVIINGVRQSPSLISVGADLESFQYYLNKTGGVFTFRTGEYADGTVVSVVVGVKRTVDGRVVKGNDLGTKGFLTITLQENGQAKTFNYIAKIMPESTEYTNDNSITDTYMLSVLDKAGTKETVGIY